MIDSMLPIMNIQASPVGRPETIIYFEDIEALSSPPVLCTLFTICNSVPADDNRTQNIQGH